MVKEVGEFVRALLWGPRGSLSRCALGRVGEIDGCLGDVWDWFGTARFDRQRTAVVVTVGFVVADGSPEFDTSRDGEDGSREGFKDGDRVVLGQEDDALARGSRAGVSIVVTVGRRV
ncbi:hypothetical protein C448_09687 [Halococcus morrhuae DSM 1307]|uniref:Uncharacterized protein n=1 Tax=Halococcus morrhuae DSM 1307 TaxID=931277 RepID=M0MDY1_HALMO|nr:hypothetical protein C448_09687 [Halococcus morrhuae DSM 1307]